MAIAIAMIMAIAEASMYVIRSVVVAKLVWGALDGGAVVISRINYGLSPVAKGLFDKLVGKFLPL